MTDVLEKCREALKHARTSLIEAGGYLHSIYTKTLWEGHFESFNAFLEDVEVSKGTASKLITIYDRFCIQGGVSQRNLSGIDYDKLYHATKLKGSPEKQLVAAQTLTRREIQDEIHSTPEGDCPHDVHICAKCHKRV